MRFPALLFRNRQSGTNQSNMGKTLREIAQSLPGLGIDFLGEQTKIVLIFEQAPHAFVGVIQRFTAERELLDCPEAANPECAFGWRTLISVKQAVTRAELVLYCTIRALHAGGIRALEAVPWNPKQRCVELVAIENTDVSLQRFIPDARFDLLADTITLSHERFLWNVVKKSFVAQGQETIECRPAHQLRMRVMCASGSRFPNALVREVPVFSDVLPQSDKYFLRDHV